MPARSKAQQHLIAAAEHGAKFPMAQKIRQSMTMPQMHDFAVGSEKNKPQHVSKPMHPAMVQRAQLVKTSHAHLKATVPGFMDLPKKQRMSVVQAHVRARMPKPR